MPFVKTVQSPVAGESWQYDYDAGDRLKTATNLSNPADTQTFTYDALDRIKTNSRIGIYDYPLPGQPRPHAPKTVAMVTYTYDANGNLKSGGGLAPVWDGENRIAAIGTTRFSYDTAGERVKKVSPAGVSLYPFGDDYEVTNGVVTKYLSVAGLGVIAKQVTGGPDPGLFWLHTDRLGSIQAVTSGQTATRAAGTIVFRRTYRPYGETLGQGGAHTESRGWIDQRNDGETGMTYLHARYYNPRTGAFLSPDPIGVAGGMNLYGYGLGDPVGLVDSTGFGAEAPPKFPVDVGCPRSGVVIPGLCPGGYHGRHTAAGSGYDNPGLRDLMRAIQSGQAGPARPPLPRRGGSRGDTKGGTTGGSGGDNGTGTGTGAGNGDGDNNCRPAPALDNSNMAPVPFMTDDGRPVTNIDARGVVRPAGWDPHFFTGQGHMMSYTPNAIAALPNFRQGGPWDAQRAGGRHTQFVPVANIYIGLYGAAAGIPESMILNITNLYAAMRSTFDFFREAPDNDYIALPKRLVDNVHTGYALQQSGQVCTP